jgi:hypothetical protein
MKKIYSCLLGLALFSSVASAQTIKGPEDINYQNNFDVYQLNPKVDIPVTAVGAGWSLYAFTKIYSKDPSTDEQMARLKKENVPSFDRWAAGMHSENADAASNILFYGSMPAPLLLLLDKEIRQDAPKVGFLYLESMAVTGLLYTGSTYFTNRFRPEAYRTDVPQSELRSGNLRNAFFAGHVALVATSTFFIAKVYGDYHPDSRLKWPLYGAAIAATGTTIYLRHKAGKHFPSDLLIGTAVGTLSGILVPHLHKTNRGQYRAWNVTPTIGNPYSLGDSGYGLSFTYTFK